MGRLYSAVGGTLAANLVLVTYYRRSRNIQRLSLFSNHVVFAHSPSADNCIRSVAVCGGGWVNGGLILQGRPLCSDNSSLVLPAFMADSAQGFTSGWV